MIKNLKENQQVNQKKLLASLSEKKSPLNTLRRQISPRSNNCLIPDFPPPSFKKMISPAPWKAKKDSDSPYDSPRSIQTVSDQDEKNENKSIVSSE